VYKNLKDAESKQYEKIITIPTNDVGVGSYWTICNGNLYYAKNYSTPVI